jgi:hypothetical protein
MSEVKRCFVTHLLSVVINDVVRKTSFSIKTDKARPTLFHDFSFSVIMLLTTSFQYETWPSLNLMFPDKVTFKTNK